MKDETHTKCRRCQGYGYDYTAPFNPSEKPQRITCPDCDGEGFIPKEETR